MTVQYYQLQWTANQPTTFEFSPVIDGEIYFCTVGYASGSRGFVLTIRDALNNDVCIQPLIPSCDCGDVQLAPHLHFKDNFVFRGSSRCFEVGGVRRQCPDFEQPPIPPPEPPPVTLDIPPDFFVPIELPEPLGTVFLNSQRAFFWSRRKEGFIVRIGDGVTAWELLPDAGYIPRVTWRPDPYIINTAAWWAANGSQLLTIGQRGIESDTGKWRQNLDPSDAPMPWGSLTYEPITIPWL
jgi:hypothetical protein